MAADISDPALYAVGAALVLPKLIELGMSLFKGSLHRNVEHEDRAKERLEADVEALKHESNERRLELQKLALEQTSHRESIATSLGNITGQLNRLDVRISESNKELAIDLNRKIASSIANEIPDLVEQTLRKLRKR